MIIPYNAYSAQSPIPSVAGATAKTIREQQQVEAQAIGAATVTQVLKALILANEYLQGDSIYVGFVPEKVPSMIQDKQASAIKFVIIILARTNPSSDH